MAAGIEIRVPFLDPDLVSLAASIPSHLKQHGATGKAVLKRAMEPRLPHDVIYRPKTGFGIPIESWLRTDLRDWAESLLSVQALQRSGVFEPAPVRAAWSKHLRGLENLQHPLWCVLMFQAWHAQWSAELSGSVDKPLMQAA